MKTKQNIDQLAVYGEKRCNGTLGLSVIVSFVGYDLMLLMPFDANTFAQNGHNAR